MTQEEAWSHPQRMSQCLNHQEFTQCCYTTTPPSSLHSVINCHILTAPETKEKYVPPGKLQLQSVDWLSTFAKIKILCSSMSFPPASLKIAFPLSMSSGVPLIRRKCEPIEITYRAGNCPALGEEKEVFVGPVKCAKKPGLFFIVMFL